MDSMAVALRDADLAARYAALRDREIDTSVDSLDPDEFAVALHTFRPDFHVPTCYAATLTGADDGRPYELWARFHVQSGAHEVEFGVAATTPRGRIGGTLADLAGSAHRPLRFRTRAHLDDAITLALEVLDRLRAIAPHAAPAPLEPTGDPILDALAGIDFGARYFALCDADVGERDEKDPEPARQEAALRAAGFEPTYEHQENFFACRLPGVDPGLAVNVIVRFALVELTAAVPAVGGGMTFHVAAHSLMTRAVPGWRHEPRYPLVPFGNRRPFEATIVEIAALARDVAAALSGIGR